MYCKYRSKLKDREEKRSYVLNIQLRKFYEVSIFFCITLSI